MKSQRSRTLLAICAATLLAGGAAWAGYNWWSGSQIAAFKANSEAALKAKEWSRLEEQARQWTTWSPESGAAWIHLATAHQEQGDIELAADCLNNVPDSDPLCLAALLHRVELLFRDLNEPLAAEQTCQRILRIDPGSAVAYQRLIFFYSQTLQRQKMVRIIREAIERRREPPEAYVYLFGADWLRFTNGYVTNSRWLESAPESELFEVARAVHLAATDDGAVSPFDTAGDAATGDRSLIDVCLAKYPRNLEVLAFFGNQAASAGDARKLQELLALSPQEAVGDNRIWRLKGWYLSAQGDTAGAEESYQKALELNPYDWRSRHELSTVLRRTGRAAEADEVANLAAEGKDLARRILEVTDPSNAPAEILLDLARHARKCGDDLVARGLDFRLGPPPDALQSAGISSSLPP